MTSVYNIEIDSLQGEKLDLNAFRGKKLLIVNVASKCGFTSQYKELQKLQDTFRDQLNVIGVPCNQFGGQEPGTASEIELFCDLRYGVDFTMTQKINVKGGEQHPLYRWLTNKGFNGVKNSSVKWNFQKYLLDESGQLIDYFFSTTKPMSSKIIKHIS